CWSFRVRVAATERQATVSWRMSGKLSPTTRRTLSSAGVTGLMPRGPLAPAVGFAAKRPCCGECVQRDAGSSDHHGEGEEAMSTSRRVRSRYPNIYYRETATG